jgi:transcriptional regulator with XRE-family HTH domain
VRRKRLRLGISQEELAARADMHRNAVGNLERGDFDPKATTLVRIAKALGTDPANLLRGLRL